MEASERSADDAGEQSFISHLVELRERLLKAVSVTGILLIGLMIYPGASRVYAVLAKPLLAQMPEGTSMIATEVASPFLTPFKMTFMLALFLAVPAIMYQAWAFVAPGLYKHEQRIATPLLISSTVLFYLGCAFAYFVVFPIIFAFFNSVAPEGVAVMTDIGKYLDFVLVLFFAFGIAFEVPIAVLILIAIGVTTREALAAKRAYVIVGAFAIGMLITPPDAISQTLLAVPMWLLFELGLFISGFVLKDRNQQDLDEP
nr:sec-independent protein translocase protein TatC-like [Nerophis lumbriciformis]